ncbi:MAG: GNAT family N-acetyltransferase [Anaerolineales bacterium]|jgi:aminoglycoside 6'-N-acetyltransferase I
MIAQGLFIRRLAPTDWGEWLRLRDALWPDTKTEEQRSEMHEILDDPQKNAVFVAVRPGGGLGGFLEVSLRPIAVGCDTQPIGYIEGWFVDPDLRRQGVGEELVTAAEEWAREHGCLEMASDCLVDNQISLLAHLALGYAEIERLIHFKKRLAQR